MATPTRTRKQATQVVVKNGMGRVFFHKDIRSVGTHGQTIDRGEVSGRTWSAEFPVEVARELIDRYEFAAGSESGVPLTFDEKSEMADLQARGSIETGRLTQALAELAKERVVENAKAEADKEAPGK
jgi:hypothetical protein